jgi:general secretion pathway protein G
MSLHRSASLSRSRRPRFSARSGLTLLEILVVLAIIALVAGLAIAKLHQIHERAQIRAAELFVQSSVKIPLAAYRLDLGAFPSTSDGLAALHTAPAQRADKWHGPYVESAKPALDPWGEPYRYACPGEHNKTGYDLWSSGPDRHGGTADDIGNWETAPTTPR